MTNKNETTQTGTLGLLTCITILMGGMVGSAIFSLSGITILKAGSSAILSWIIAGALMLIYGLVVAELSAIYPKSGGVFVFPSKALGKTEKEGKMWGWISTWGYLNGNIVSTAFAALSIGTYLSVGFPIFKGKEVPLAVTAVLFCFVLNMFKLSVAGKANTLLIIGIVVSLMIFIIFGFTKGNWDSGSFTPFFTQGTVGAGGFLAAVPTAMIAYGSIVAIGFMVTEVKDPNKNVPKSILIAMTLVISLYVLTLLATLGMITAGFLTENPQYTVTPLYAAAFTKLAAYPWLPQVISIAAVFALLSTMLVVTALTSRVIAASAEGDCMPKLFAKTNGSGVPIYATCLTTLLCILTSCFPQFLSNFVSLCSLFVAVTISINCISLLVARKKNTYKAGNFRMPGGSVLPILALITIIICYIPDIIKGGWKIWVYTFGWYMAGLLIYKLRAQGKKSNTPLKTTGQQV